MFFYILLERIIIINPPNKNANGEINLKQIGFGKSALFVEKSWLNHPK